MSSPRSTKSVLLSARISPKLSANLDRVAKRLDRSRSWVVSQALENYVESEAEFLASIEKSRKDVKSGRYKDHDAFMAELTSRYVRRP